VGRNSSGKSSLAHALLLLRQSIEQRAIGTRVPQLTLKGPLIDAGRFEDIVYGHDVEQTVEFTFDISLVQGEFELRSSAQRSSLIRFDIPRPSIRPGYRYYSRRSPREIQKLVEEHPNIRVAFRFSPQAPFGPTLQQFDVSAAGLGDVSFRRTAKRHRIQHWRAYTKSLPANALNIVLPLWTFLPAVRSRDRIGRRLTEAHRQGIDDFLTLANAAISDVERFLGDIRFLGPFRTPPSRSYTFAGVAATDTGPNGERAVDLLITELLLHPRNRQLAAEVSRWMRKLTLAQNVRIRSVARRSNIFELSVSGAGPKISANFADVGFGISQVLPVIVQGYFVPKGGTYVVQQPELHLHPDAQAVLADFFLFLASRGIHSLVETHSEYLLLRLRRRLAEGARSARRKSRQALTTGDHRPRIDDVQVMFVGEKDQSAVLLPLNLGESFQFENMPDGFMSQAVDDRMRLLKALRA